MNELTLQWREKNQFKIQAIGDQHPSREAGVVRLGRDPARCDIVLQDRSVSGLHVELFWQHDQFYIRNLRASNPPLVDQMPLPQGERPLHQGSKICLGRIELTVTAISVPVVKSPAEQGSESYGIKCPNADCGQVLPYTSASLQQGCPHCGSSLAAGVTVVGNPG
ncbi:MAG: FHA domain-containing protein [Cyanobacteria bacterium P01_A01_bin.17]